MLTIPFSTTLEIIIRDTKNKDVESYINMELTSISDWPKTNKLSLSIEKSKSPYLSLTNTIPLKCLHSFLGL